MSRGEEEQLLQEKLSNPVSDEPNSGKSSKVSNNQKNSQKYRNRRKYNSSEEESDENMKPRQKNPVSNSKNGIKKRPSNKDGKSLREKTPENVSDLERVSMQNIQIKRTFLY